MRTLVFASSFKRSFKVLIREKKCIELKISEKLDLLTRDPFHPFLRTHKLNLKVSYLEHGHLRWSMIAELYST